MKDERQVRRSVTLPEPTARKVASIARRRRLSDNRVLVELIEEGIESRNQKEKAFFELAERLRSSQDAAEVRQLGEQLGVFAFGDSADAVRAMLEFAEKNRTRLRDVPIKELVHEGHRL